MRGRKVVKALEICGNYDIVNNKSVVKIYGPIIFSRPLFVYKGISPEEVME